MKFSDPPHPGLKHGTIKVFLSPSHSFPQNPACSPPICQHLGFWDEMLPFLRHWPIVLTRLPSPRPCQAQNFAPSASTHFLQKVTHSPHLKSVAFQGSSKLIAEFVRQKLLVMLVVSALCFLEDSFLEQVLFYYFCWCFSYIWGTKNQLQRARLKLWQATPDNLARSRELIALTIAVICHFSNIISCKCSMMIGTPSCEHFKRWKDKVADTVSRCRVNKRQTL